jgi:inosine-uridine nucleoside N-ribohydrolase
MNIAGPNNVHYEMNSRHDLVQFIYALQSELKTHPERWENVDLQTYLGALAAFLSDAHGYYRNANINVDADVPSWRLVADCLQAASAYD